VEGIGERYREGKDEGEKKEKGKRKVKGWGRGKGRGKRKGKAKGMEKGKVGWKKDSLRKVGRTDTQVVLYSVQCYA